MFSAILTSGAECNDTVDISLLVKFFYDERGNVENSAIAAAILLPHTNIKWSPRDIGVLAEILTDTKSLAPIPELLKIMTQLSTSDESHRRFLVACDVLKHSMRFVSSAVPLVRLHAALDLFIAMIPHSGVAALFTEQMYISPLLDLIDDIGIDGMELAAPVLQRVLTLLNAFVSNPAMVKILRGCNVGKMMYALIVVATPVIQEQTIILLAVLLNGEYTPNLDGEGAAAMVKLVTTFRDDTALQNLAHVISTLCNKLENQALLCECGALAAVTQLLSDASLTPDGVRFFRTAEQSLSAQRTTASETREHQPETTDTLSNSESTAPQSPPWLRDATEQIQTVSSTPGSVTVVSPPRVDNVTAAAAAASPSAGAAEAEAEGSDPFNFAPLSAEVAAARAKEMLKGEREALQFELNAALARSQSEHDLAVYQAEKLRRATLLTLKAQLEEIVAELSSYEEYTIDSAREKARDLMDGQFEMVSKEETAARGKLRSTLAISQERAMAKHRKAVAELNVRELALAAEMQQ
eukprot:TRINITY_DN8156_c0_g1_i1.p1 TRINITY_DN8156_c0_g1~~TRINITY_DN8156_c0_g1_i1.p1  ORF type:complete len:525 (-),score=137.93 TRINITY_DN8156_c0_g1_i1:25-1599(-)